MKLSRFENPAIEISAISKNKSLKFGYLIGRSDEQWGLNFFIEHKKGKSVNLHFESISSDADYDKVVSIFKKAKALG